MDDATVKATLKCLPTIPADMVRFQRCTGCRPEEVCALRPCDLDRSGDVWTYRPESHKTEHHGRERMIFIGPNTQKVLLRYLARDAQTHCFRPCDSEAKRLAEQERNRKTPLSCGTVRGSKVKRKPKRKPSTKYTTRSYRRAIHRVCDQAGIDRWSPNRLRHAKATEVRKESGLEGAQIILAMHPLMSARFMRRGTLPRAWRLHGGLGSESTMWATSYQRAGGPLSLSKVGADMVAAKLFRVRLE